MGSNSWKNASSSLHLEGPLSSLELGCYPSNRGWRCWMAGPLRLAGEQLARHGRSLHSLGPFPRCLCQLFSKLLSTHANAGNVRGEMARFHKGFYC